LPHAEKATLKISDISGRVVKMISGDFEEGYNQITLGKPELNVSGVLYYELVTSFGTQTRKMIVIE
ncbi:MAG: T9SS type A sorting domain-containing protein, partial [Bacteroidia bacterium]|nr:T9SS type A sorting domain-containing protein [Bacteroidia bacterium]